MNVIIYYWQFWQQRRHAGITWHDLHVFPLIANNSKVQLITKEQIALLFFVVDLFYISVDQRKENLHQLACYTRHLTSLSPTQTCIFNWQAMEVSSS